MQEKHYPPPTFEITNQNKGIEDILDIDSHFILNVGNSVKREEKNEMLKKEIIKILFCSIFKKIIKNSKQHSINIKNYTAHP